MKKKKEKSKIVVDTSLEGGVTLTGTRSKKENGKKLGKNINVCTFKWWRKVNKLII